MLVLLLLILDATSEVSNAVSDVGGESYRSGVYENMDVFIKASQGCARSVP